MRVLHVINSMQGGGAENLLFEMLPRLKDNTDNIAAITLLEQWTKRHQYLEELGIDVKALGARTKYSIPVMRRLYNEFRKGQYDVIHSHLFPSQYFVALLPQDGKFFFTTEHNTYNRRRNHAFFKLTDKKVYSRYHKIICISKAAARSLQTWLPEIRHKTSVIYNGKDFERYTHIKTVKKDEKGFKDNVPLVISVASLTDQKNHVTLIRAVAELPDVQLLIVGNGPLRNQLQALSHSLGLDKRVHFLGYREDIPELLALADVFVMSSKWEGFGLAAVEAMAAGTPVIASDVPGLDEVVEHGKSGLLFPPQDTSGLAKNIRLLINDENERQKMVEGGKKRAHSFRIERTVLEYMDLYKSVIPS